MTLPQRLWALGAGLLLIVFLASAANSPSFRECAADHKGANQNSQITDEKPAGILLSGRMIVCTLEVIEHNEKLIIVLATIVIAFFTGTLWASTRGLHQATRKLVEAADGQAADLKEAIVAINATATAGAEANVIAERALHSSDRAWVGADGFYAKPPPENGIMMVGLNVRNTGHSPALRTRILLKPFIRHKNDAEPDIPVKADGASTLLLPNQFVMNDVLGGHFDIDETRFKSIANGTEILWVTGRVDYFDVNEQERFTTIRVFYNPAYGWFTSSKEGNHAT